MNQLNKEEGASKIAIPTKNNQVDDHFGHCTGYTVFTVSGNTILKIETIESPQGCGCKSEIASILKQQGVNTMLAGNIGQGAINKLGEAGIQVVRGCSGNTEAVATAFLNGKLTDNGLTCAQHQHGEGCSHH